MVVGILGGGQLARMLALAGLPLGLRFRCLDPSPTAVAGHASELIVGAYDDPSALARLVRGVRTVTFEFENVPAAAAAWLTEHADVAPRPEALAVAQDRVAEKRLFAELGIAVPRYAEAGSAAELAAAVATIGVPCIVKTRRLGYDGKGQRRIGSGEDVAGAVASAYAELGGTPGGLVVEQLVRFDRELSILAVRGRDGTLACYPLTENEHRGGILRLSRAPAPALSAATAAAAEQLARAVAERLDYVGVLAIELFEVGGRLLANEMAPRVHNSGHWTIEGAVCSQFENHLRAILGFPLGSTAMAGGGHAAMVNLIGELPSRTQLLAVPQAHVHVYGKGPRPDRKLGHVTMVGPSAAELALVAHRVAALPPAAEGEWPSEPSGS